MSRTALLAHEASEETRQFSDGGRGKVGSVIDSDARSTKQLGRIQVLKTALHPPDTEPVCLGNRGSLTVGLFPASGAPIGKKEGLRHFGTLREEISSCQSRPTGCHAVEMSSLSSNRRSGLPAPLDCCRFKLKRLNISPQGFFYSRFTAKIFKVRDCPRLAEALRLSGQKIDDGALLSQCA